MEPEPTPAEPEQTPTEAPDEMAPAPASPAPLLPGETSARPDAGLLNIRVPSEAKVFINGLETSSKGAERQYVSYGLKPGLTYKYEVRAVLKRGGKQFEDLKVVYLTAGATEGLAFDLRSAPAHKLVSTW
jgi:uncharacterized protein (TIGR03000 family)